MGVNLTGTKPTSVLLIDDDEILLQELSESIEAFGSVVFKLPDATRLDRKSLEVFDLVVLDISMPGVDGFEVINRLAGCARKPDVILLTGFGADILQSAKMATELAGANVRAAFTKPVNVRDLALALVPHHVSSKGLGEANPTFTVEEIEEALAELATRPDEFMFLPRAHTKDCAISGFLVQRPADLPGLGPVPPILVNDVLRRNSRLSLDLLAGQIAAAGSVLRALPAYGNSIANIKLPLHIVLDEALSAELTGLCDRVEDPTQITFIMQQGELLQQNGALLPFLTRLRMRGFGLALEEVGRSDSALSQVASLAITEIRIDAELVRQALVWPKSSEILDAFSEMARRTSLKVAVKGVDTYQDLCLVRNAGMDLFEGTLLSPALSASALKSFYAVSETGPDTAGHEK